jgi:hypothetical protein
MFTIISAIALWLTFNVCYWWMCRASNGDKDSAKALVAFMSLFGVALATLAVQACLIRMLPIKEVDTTFQLAAMRTSDSPSGTFVWGNGRVADSLYYHVLVRNADTSVSPQQIDSQASVRIVEDKSLQNEGRWTTLCNHRDYSAPLGSWVFLQEADQVCDNVFTVPVGTVIHSFSAQ